MSVYTTPPRFCAPRTLAPVWGVIPERHGSDEKLSEWEVDTSKMTHQPTRNGWIGLGGIGGGGVGCKGERDWRVGKGSLSIYKTPSRAADNAVSAGCDWKAAPIDWQFNLFQ